jgi:fumarate hydratase, class II
MGAKGFRLERDFMGAIRVPARAYWGAETQRAVENFPISGLRFPRSFLRALGMIKMAAVQVNTELKLLPAGMGRGIARASREVMEGKWDDQFILDIFQTGSGTSTHMNANEVIARRANEILGGRKIGNQKPVHPNDHVNLGQSSNDVIPSAIHISALEEMERKLIPALKGLEKALAQKAREFTPIIKLGRTHLQDAVPMRLGQEFSGYAGMVRHGIGQLENARTPLQGLALGGTAVGTGLNAHPRFARRVVEKINRLTGLRFRETENHFAAQGAKDAVVAASAALKTLAVSLMKDANDIRFLGSGPRGGIGELILPEVQPGSSIMPGKVNPVIPEALCQVAAQVIGNDAAVAIGGLSGNFELNVMMPVMAHNLLESIRLLTHAAILFNEKCIRGLRADEKRCRELVEKSLAMATALSPHIGHDAAVKIAREAYDRGKTIREVVMEKGVLPAAILDRLLDPVRMITPKNRVRVRVRVGKNNNDP